MLPTCRITSNSFRHHPLQISVSPFSIHSSSLAWSLCSPAQDLVVLVLRWDSTLPLRRFVFWERAGTFLLLRLFSYRELHMSQQLPFLPRYRILSGPCCY